MLIPFAKYQATGNDFVLVDNQQALLPAEAVQAYAQLCHRRFGIGSDGLIFIQPHATLAFEMVYYNSDGRLGSMCGNGARAAVHYAQRLGLVQDQAQFWTYDGQHQASLSGNVVTLEMKASSPIAPQGADAWYVHTGSPHHIEWVQEIDSLDVAALGPPIRYSQRYAPDGCNVNFVRVLAPNHLQMRTYERGVEAETYSCGTGVTAAALVYAAQLLPQAVFEITVDTPGGQLKVLRDAQGQVFLQGPATHVFDGKLETTAFGL